MGEEQPKVEYEDEHILVVDKPAGLIVNRADTTAHVAVLQDWVEEYLEFKTISRDELGDFVNRSGIVHRLDKETSGVIIIAKHKEAFENLQQQFKNRTVSKMYTALVHGKVTPEKGEINVPVGRVPWNRKKFGVVVQGKDAMTQYTVTAHKTLQEGKKEYDYSLVNAFPKTGRTHQIRVHFRYLGYPIAGDELYAGRKNLQQDRKYLSRHFLHASRITFHHPQTNELLEISSSLPRELVDFIDRLH